MGIYKGSSAVTAVYLGSTRVRRVYKGAAKLWAWWAGTQRATGSSQTSTGNTLERQADMQVAANSITVVSGGALVVQGEQAGAKVSFSAAYSSGDPGSLTRKMQTRIKQNGVTILLDEYNSKASQTRTGSVIVDLQYGDQITMTCKQTLNWDDDPYLRARWIQVERV